MIAMTEPQARKLAAILAADIAGYSALMGADEARTVRDLKEHQAVVLPMVGQFGGRVIDTAGDGILAEFASVVNALECAVAIQAKMVERNKTIEPERRMRFRMGINIGDVIYDEARIYGDGINIAARLEGIAEPGGIYLSRQAYDQVDGKLAVSFRGLGPQNLKNIVKPVEVFAVEGIGALDNAVTVALGWLVSSTGGNLDERTATARQLLKFDPLDERARRQLMELLAQSGNPVEAIRQYQICVEVLNDALGIKPDSETQRVFEQIKRSQDVSKSTMAFAPDARMELVDAQPSEDRPVVAVFPFANLSGDPSFAYFADGLADDLIFSLSAFRWFRVLAQASTFRLRDAGVSHADVRRMFGATHLVNGRMRRSGSALRVNVELVDCKTGQQMWSGRYDRTLDDLFDVQDDVTKRVAAGIEPTLEDSEMRRTMGRPAESLTAYEFLHRGYWHLYRRTSRDNEEANVASTQRWPKTRRMRSRWRPWPTPLIAKRMATQWRTSSSAWRIAEPLPRMLSNWTHATRARSGTMAAPAASSEIRTRPLALSPGQSNCVPVTLPRIPGLPSCMTLGANFPTLCRPPMKPSGCARMIPPCTDASLPERSLIIKRASTSKRSG
jgi:adenylate cyclase